eukprot:m.142676 g.142676  ORF g.142676 m.142676 type:complete len:263 (-) comp16718_c1_seq1:121-909(-)
MGPRIRSSLSLLKEKAKHFTQTLATSLPQKKEAGAGAGGPAEAEITKIFLSIKYDPEKEFGFLLRECSVPPKVDSIAYPMICPDVRLGDTVRTLNGDDVFKMTGGQLMAAMRQLPKGSNLNIELRRTKGMPARPPPPKSPVPAETHPHSHSHSHSHAQAQTPHSPPPQPSRVASHATSLPPAHAPQPSSSHSNTAHPHARPLSPPQHHKAAPKPADAAAATPGTSSNGSSPPKPEMRASRSGTMPARPPPPRPAPPPGAGEH